MKTYTIIGGVNGAGKSSLSGALSSIDHSFGLHIDPDKLIKIAGSLIKGGKTALGIFSYCLESGIDFSQEITLSGKRPLKNIEAARKNEYCIRLFYVGVSSAEECLSRIENRVKKGGHNIPSSDVIRRFQNRFNDLTEILPYCDEAYFYDNENGFAYVGEYDNGQIFTQGDYTPNWLKELKNYCERRE